MNVVAIGLGAAVLVLIVILSLMFLRKRDDGMAEYKDFSLTGAMQQDPVEQYVQQLIAQGYPEDTARAYAAQYAAQAGLGGGAARRTTTACCYAKLSNGCCIPTILPAVYLSRI